MSDGDHGIRPMELQGHEIVKRIAAGLKRISLVCPYVTSREILHVIRSCAAPAKQLLTRYNPADILMGATDLGIIRELVAAHVDVRVLKDVHAKVYVVDDDWAYVGSANLTDSGLKGSLREFGRASGDAIHVDEARKYFERIWGDARTVSLEDLDSALEKRKHIASEEAAASRARQQAEKHLALTWSVPPTPGQYRRDRDNLTVDTPHDSLEEMLIDVSGSVKGAEAIARVIARAIRAVQNFERSKHWTFNQPRTGRPVLRLNVGRVEVLTISFVGRELRTVALAEELPEQAREAIKSVGGWVEKTPYETVQRIAGDAGGHQIGLPLKEVERFEQLLHVNLKSYLQRDRSESSSVFRRFFSADAVRIIARLAHDPQLEMLANSLIAGRPGDN